MSLEITSSGRSVRRGQHAGQLLAEALQVLQFAGVNRDADNAALRR